MLKVNLVMFVFKLLNGAINNTPRWNRKSEIQDGGWNNVIARISANDSNTVLKLITRFQCHKRRSKNNDAVRCLGMS